jgi:hypothetical protein
MESPHSYHSHFEDKEELVCGTAKARMRYFAAKFCGKLACFSRLLLFFARI